MKGLRDQEYEFRVRAKNSAGVSEPSNPIAVDVKPKYSKYILTYQSMSQPVDE